MDTSISTDETGDRVDVLGGFGCDSRLAAVLAHRAVHVPVATSHQQAVEVAVRHASTVSGWPGWTPTIYQQLTHPGGPTASDTGRLQATAAAALARHAA